MSPGRPPIKRRLKVGSLLVRLRRGRRLGRGGLLRLGDLLLLLLVLRSLVSHDRYSLSRKRTSTEMTGKAPDRSDRASEGFARRGPSRQGALLRIVRGEPARPFDYGRASIRRSRNRIG